MSLRVEIGSTYLLHLLPSLNSLGLLQIANTLCGKPKNLAAKHEPSEHQYQYVVLSRRVKTSTCWLKHEMCLGLKEGFVAWWCSVARVLNKIPFPSSTKLECTMCLLGSARTIGKACQQKRMSLEKHDRLMARLLTLLALSVAASICSFSPNRACHKV